MHTNIGTLIILKQRNQRNSTVLYKISINITSNMYHTMVLTI